MIQLLAGLALWSGAHALPRVVPGLHARLGRAARGVVAVMVLLGLWLMIRGYGAQDAVPRFAPAPWAWHLNYLMVLVAIYLFAASGMKTRAAAWLRHPQLLAVVLWGGAHLLVNTHWAAGLLFGGLAVWAVAEMVLLDTRAPVPVAPAPAPVGREVAALLGAVAVFILIALVHGWIGPNPFGAMS